VTFIRKHWVKLIASALITVGLLYTLARGGLKMVPDGGDFTGIKWWAIAAYPPIWFTMTWFRSVRWRYLLKQVIEVPKKRLFTVSLAGLCAILLMPFRLGELARPMLLYTREEERTTGAPVLTFTAATSSIIAERVIDGLFLSVLLAIVLLAVPTLDPLPDKVVGIDISVQQARAFGYATLALFTTAMITIAVFYFFRSWADRATRLIIGKISPRIAGKLADFVEKLADGLHVFSRGRDFLGFLGETTIYWGLNAFGMYVLALGCGVVHGDGSAITFAETCGLMGMLGCAILIPGPPGMLGVFQAGIYAGMSMYLPAAVVIGPGAAFVFLLYILQVILHLITGAWGLWHEGGARRLRGI
jgi:glycosyltransferase 2 family protein